MTRSVTRVPNPFRYHFTGARGSPEVALMAIGRAADERDELAPSHSITSSARNRSVGGIVIPIAIAVFRFTARLELGWLFDRQIRRLCAAQNLVNEGDDMPETEQNPRSVAK